MSEANPELDSKDSELDLKDSEFDSKDSEVYLKDPEVDSKDPEIDSKDSEVDSKASVSLNEAFKAPIIPKIISSKKLVALNPDNEAPKTLEKNKLIYTSKLRAIPASIYKPYQPKIVSKNVKKEQKNYENGQTENKRSESSESTDSKEDEQSNRKKSAPLKLNYDAPSWSKIAEKCEEEKSYYLEVLKDGAIIDQLKLVDKCFVVFGRLRTCDFVLDHPSVSRNHCVLQYGSPNESDQVELQKDGSSGWYLYDLKSTHGSYVNKAKVKAQTYYRIKVGHMIKFGTSSRIYILQGPDEDQEEEAKETVTELQEKARARKLQREALIRKMMGEDSSSDEDEKITPKKEDKMKESSGISWGMLEDAVNDDEDDSSDEEKVTDKDLLAHLDKDRFYNKDPHKALKHFHDKEGIEINFTCTERRPGQWLTRLELPITNSNGKPVVAEATVTGKRSQSMYECALEACQLLDKHGMFNREESTKRKKKEWEKEDFYDSDEDGYLDRTGDLDVKRRNRALRFGKKFLQEKAETYDSLTSKIKLHEAEISEIELKLEKDRKVTKVEEDSEDSLQVFMRNIKEGRTLDSNTRSKLKIRLLSLRKTLLRLSELQQVAKPTNMPALKYDSKKMSLMSRMLQNRRLQAFQNKKPNPPKQSSSNEIEEEEEEDEDQLSDLSRSVKDEEAKNLLKSQDQFKEPAQPEERIKKDQTLKEDQKKEDQKKEDKEEEDQVHKDPKEEDRKQPNLRIGPTISDELKRKLADVSVTETDSVESQKRKRKRIKNKKLVDLNEPDSELFAGWMPPDSQCGDGKTKLNEKFGY